MKKILLLSLIIMTLSVLLLAQKPTKSKKGKSPECPMKQEMKAPEMMKKLNLSEEQKAKIDAIKDTHVKYMNSQKAELQNLKIDRQNAMKAEDYGRVKQINKSISDMKLEMQNRHVDHIQAIKKELNAEQKEKFEQLHQKKNMGKFDCEMSGKGDKPQKGMPDCEEMDGCRGKKK